MSKQPGKIIVHCEAHLGGDHTYEHAATWRVDGDGGLRIVNEADRGLAAYPAGRWLWVERVLDEVSS